MDLVVDHADTFNDHGRRFPGPARIGFGRRRKGQFALAEVEGKREGPQYRPADDGGHVDILQRVGVTCGELQGEAARFLGDFVARHFQPKAVGDDLEGVFAVAERE